MRAHGALVQFIAHFMHSEVLTQAVRTHTLSLGIIFTSAQLVFVDSKSNDFICIYKIWQWLPPFARL